MARRVFVTGGGGFVGSNMVNLLLQKKYHVVTTMRTSTRKTLEEKKVGSGKYSESTVPFSEFDRISWTEKLATSQLEIIDLDLLENSTDEWYSAMKDCDIVIHTASPFPIATPDNEDDLIKPAVEGTRKILLAAEKAKIPRVSVTASTATIASRDVADFSEKEGKIRKGRDENPWNNIDVIDVEKFKPAAYQKSKILAEKCAWEMKASGEYSGDLTTVHPSYILGPTLLNRGASSHRLNQRLMNGEFPLGLVPPIGLSIADVRDVVDVHLACILREPVSPKEKFSAKAEENSHSRFLVQSGSVDLTEIRDELTKTAKTGEFEPLIEKGQVGKIPKRTAPWLAIAIIALWDKEAAAAKGMWKETMAFDTESTQKLLARPLRNVMDAVVDNARSLIEVGMLA